MNQFLYMMVDGRYCKIGISANPERRRKEIWYPSYVSGVIRMAPAPKQWGPWENAFKIESRIKALLASRSISRSTEWFRISESRMIAVINEAVERINKGYALPWTASTAHRYFGKSGRPPGNPGNED